LSLFHEHAIFTPEVFRANATISQTRLLIYARSTIDDDDVVDVDDEDEMMKIKMREHYIN
jgi:hypothetical protein